MADTPRVTVPVEPEYTATDYLRLIAEGWEVIESTGSQMTIQNPEDEGPQDLVIEVDAMLSAAPAPEGGAVKGRTFKDQRAQKAYDLFLREGWMRGDIERFYRSGFAGVARPDESNTPRIAVWLAGRDRAEAGLPHGIPDRPEFRNLTAALATRVESPAETTDCKRCAGNGEIVTDWNEYLSPPKGAPADHATADCPDCGGIGKAEAPAEAGEEDVRGLIGEAIQGLERAITSTRFDSASKEVFAACVDDFRKVLRAQPPAREDAQPVARVDHAAPGGIEWKRGFSRLEHGAPLYTHPAPDALRAAVAAYLTAVDDLETPVMSPSLGLHRKEVARQARGKLREALAALQAEQKGGA